MSEKEGKTSNLDALREEFIEPASMLVAIQQVYGDKVREASKEAYGQMLQAHLLLAGVLKSVIGRTHGNKEPYSAVAVRTNALLATYVLGMPLCDDAIDEGRYLQAHALLRQEMELLARMKALAAGNATPGKAPQIATLEASLRRAYGYLSDAMHLTRDEIVEAATMYAGAEADEDSETRYTRFFPQFQHDVARRSFALHLFILILILEHVAQSSGAYVSPHSLTDREREAIQCALDLLVAEGMVSLPAAD